MSFILFDHGAASSIISERSLQAAEFVAGERLALLLRSPSAAHEPITSQAHLVEEAGGLYVLSRTETRKHYVIFDLGQCDPFTNSTDQHCVLVLQRVLRFAVRIWENMTMSSHDRLIPNSTKVAVFPIPLNSYRLTIERLPDPDPGTQSRTAGNHLLVYKLGTDRGEGAYEVPETATFQAAIESIGAARRKLESSLATVKGEQARKALELTELQKIKGEPISPHVGFTQWLHLLTGTQLEFVTRDTVRPERIEGPAGTGKTLSLVLKCINTLRMAQEQDREHHAIFITYGDAMRSAVEDVFESNDEYQFCHRNRNESRQSVTITTLQSWCGLHLNGGISETEYLDRDAMEARNTRLLYVCECVEQIKQQDLATYKSFLSPEFYAFFSREDSWAIAEMVQHEIAVMIKGRSDESLERYRALPPLHHNLPILNDSDKGYVFSIFKKYQGKIVSIGQFDTDDVVLSAIGQLHTPIWRRRRTTEGFDSVYIDETHLFNLNELSVFHYMTRSESVPAIVFSVDRTQAPGDRGLTEAIMSDVMLSLHSGSTVEETEVHSVFRCSPDITDLALSVTAAGATLFTEFENSLQSSTSVFTHEDEKKCRRPELRLSTNDNAMVTDALIYAQEMSNELQCSKSDIAIVAFSDEVFRLIDRHAQESGRPVELVKRRGDIEALKRAKKSGRFVLAAPDYIGGLEFAGAILVAVDDGRVPPVSASSTQETRHFLSFSYHARLYVAITRAKFRVLVLANKERGVSKLLDNAIEKEFLLLTNS